MTADRQADQHKIARPARVVPLRQTFPPGVRRPRAGLTTPAKRGPFAATTVPALVYLHEHEGSAPPATHPQSKTVRVHEDRDRQTVPIIIQHWSAQPWSASRLAQP